MRERNNERYVMLVYKYDIRTTTLIIHPGVLFVALSFVPFSNAHHSPGNVDIVVTLNSILSKSFGA